MTETGVASSFLSPDELVELLWAGIEDLTMFHAEGEGFQNLIKAYANAYARFQLQRVENDLKRNGSFSAAHAVAAQAALLEVLAKGF